MKPVDMSNQLKIEKHGLIMTFKHKRSGDRYAVPMSHMRAMIFGGFNFIFANEWIPKATGRPHGSKDSHQRERTPKNKIIIPL